MVFKIMSGISGIILVFLSGCATITPQQQATLQESVPMCFGEKDCEFKWAAARKWVLNNSSRKIQIYSDDLIETYNPAPNSPSLAVRITKEPAGTGAYAITARVWCNNIFGCVPKKAYALLDFNNYVNSVVVENNSRYKDLLKESKYSKSIMGTILININGKVIVKLVSSGSPAEKAGMQKQDIITQFAGNDIYDMKGFQQALEKVSFGKEVEINVMRGNITIPLRLKFPSENELQKIRESNENINSAANSNDIEAKIGSLDRLLKKGLITQEEFNKKKTELLEKY